MPYSHRKEAGVEYFRAKGVNMLDKIIGGRKYG